MASHKGAVRAKSMGYTNVYVMSAGTEGWTKAGKPTQKI
jgi:rhodanese-related sulfurtransferase